MTDEQFTRYKRLLNKGRSTNLNKQEKDELNELGRVRVEHIHTMNTLGKLEREHQEEKIKLPQYRYEWDFPKKS